MTTKPIINFFSEDVGFLIEKPQDSTRWLLEIAKKEKKKINCINYVFCTDDYLLEINKQYLNHDYFTDIISFQHNELDEDIEGDIYISIERVKENSSSLKQAFEAELFRVVSHGLLHFLGYRDKTEEESGEMRKKEDWCLSLRDF